MVKNYSFYQFIMTVRGRKDDKGVFAEQIFEDLAFPKHEDDIANSPYQCLYLMTCMMTIRNG